MNEKQVLAAIKNDPDYAGFFDFWSKKLAIMDTATALADPESHGVSSEMKEHQVLVSGNRYEQLLAMAPSASAKLAVVLSAIHLTLQQYTGSSASVFTTPMIGGKKATKNTLGQSAIVIDGSKVSTSRELLMSMGEQLNATIKHQDFPLQSYIEEQAGTALGAYSSLVIESPVLHGNNRSEEPCDLKLTINIEEAQLKLDWSFNEAVFTKRFVDQFAQHVCRTIEFVCSTEARESLSAYQMLSKEELNHVFSIGCGPKQALQSDRFLTTFEKQVSQNADALAIQHGDEKLSYSALDERSSKMASYLDQNYKLEASQPVVLWLEQSIETVVSMLAIWKLGLPFVPVDGSSPLTRNLTIVRECKAQMVITTLELFPELSTEGCQLFVPEIQSDFLDVEVSEISREASEIAYIIYTSGSTGVPKGVAVKNAGFTNYLNSTQGYFSGVNIPCMPFFGSPAFDLNLTSIFAPLFFGGNVHVFADSEVDQRLKKMLSADVGINAVKLTPSHLRLIEHLDKENVAWQSIIAGGEALLPSDVAIAKTLNSSVRIFNEYGPTEATVGCSVEEVVDANDINIGTAMDNAKLFVLGTNRKPLPIGVVGELAIAGTGLAHGYLNDRERTNQAFIDTPASLASQEVDKVYLTGDLCYFRSDGKLQYIGRRDDQVKIRGFRIELEEVSATLQRHASISDVVALVADDADGSKSLAAYFLSEKTLDTTEVQQWMTKEVPAYMVPARIHQVDSFPLTPSGKLDLKAISALGTDLSASQNKVLPVSDEEKAMALIWEECLAVETVGVEDDFFLLGGDSIKAIRLLSMINAQNGVQLAVADLFGNRTIKELLESVVSAEKQVTPEESEDFLKDLNSGDREALPQSISDAYPLSKIQLGMLFHTLADPNKSAYRNQHIYQLGGELDHARLSKAFQLLIGKHDQLRTSFHGLSTGDYLQCVNTKVEFSLELEDFSSLSEEARKGAINSYLKADEIQGMDYRSGLLYHTKLFKQSTVQHTLVFSIHHAIVDGWSIAIFMTELFKVYHNLKADENLVLPRLQSSFGDYIRQSENEVRYQKLEAWWSDYLVDFESQPVPTNIDVEEHEGEGVTRAVIDEKVVAQIEMLAQKAGVSVNAICMTAYAYWLRLMSGRKKVTFGLVGNTRPTVLDSEKLFGCFLNTVPIKIDLENATFEEAIKRVHDSYLDVKSKDQLPIQDIADIYRHYSDEQLFDTYYNFTDFHVYGEVLGDESGTSLYEQSGLTIEHESFEKIDVAMALKVDYTLGNVNAELEFNTASYSQKTAEKYLGWFAKVLENLVANSTAEWNQTEMVYQLDSHHFDGFSKEVADVEISQNVGQIWQAAMASTPLSVALICEEREYTFDQIQQRINWLCAQLRNTNLKQGDRVAVMLDRSEWSSISILSLLSLGMVYIPIDSTFPEERIQMILDEGNPEAIITSSKHEALAQNRTTILIGNATQQEFANSQQVIYPAVETKSDAYIMFTSGSSGKPKGVRLSHENLCSHFPNMALEYKINASDRIIAHTNSVFDISLIEQLFILLRGGSLVMLNKDEARNPAEIVASGIKHNVTCFQSTPSMLKLVLEEHDAPQFFKQLTTVISGGEMFSKTVLDELTKYPRIDLQNAYGPTETTIWSTLARPKNEITIGKPLYGERIYLLTENLQAIPVGAIGEICIGGPSLATDYYGSENLTAEKFVQYKGERVYRTGDLARWLANGEIEYLGRIDDQVKIRGNRIELGEIAHVLKTKLGFKDAFIDAQDNNGHIDLVAYIVTRDSIETSAIAKELGNYLPQYMVPTTMVGLEELPMTPNGKLDRKRLPATTTSSNSSREFVAARTDVERMIVALIEDVLGGKEIGVKDNFFELGINSIMSIKIFRKLDLEFPGELNISDLFSYTSVEELAAQLEGDQEAGVAAVTETVQEFEF